MKTYMETDIDETNETKHAGIITERNATGEAFNDISTNGSKKNKKAKALVPAKNITKVDLTGNSIGFPFVGVFRMSEGNLMRFTKTILEKNGYADISRSKTNFDYMYGKGDIPVLLVAHIDTVFKSLPQEIFYDALNDSLWAKEGLGADDRAGVAAILSVVEAGLKPHVLLLDYEESGCHGAKRAAHELGAPDVNIIIELDRKGNEDSVYYSCDNPKMEAYVNAFGFKTDHGTFTDITTLCPKWKIGGVNLSTGYYNAHSKDEYLVIKEWRTTVDKVIDILKSPPTEKFDYIEKTYQYSRWHDDYDSYDRWETRSTGTGVYCPSICFIALDFKDRYGGTYNQWFNYLSSNKKDIASYLEKVKENLMDELVSTFIPDFWLNDTDAGGDDDEDRD
jgi:hypothetical protein